MAFTHLPHAWREPWYCLAPALPSLITPLLALGGVVLPPPGGSWGAGPRSVQRLLCLGWKQLFSPLWKHGLGLIIKLSEAGSKGTEAWGAEITELSSESLTTCHRPLILAPFCVGWVCVSLGVRRKLGETGSLPLLALRVQVTALASRALGVNVQRGTTW